MKCRIGIGSACRGDGWKIEEVGQTVAIVLRRRETLELLDVERKAEIAVHEPDHVRAFAHHEGNGLIVANRNANTAGQASKRSRHQNRPSIQSDKTIRSIPRIASV